MNPKRYIIFYDWKPCLTGYNYYERFETNFLVVMVIKFLMLRLKYDIIDVEFRK